MKLAGISKLATIFKILLLLVALLSLGVSILLFYPDVVHAMSKAGW